MGKIVANKSLKVDAKQLACAHSSLILANNFAPVSEALGFTQIVVLGLAKKTSNTRMKL
jgi:hypothetical protein